MKIYEFGDDFCRTTIATYNRSSRVPFFVYFRENVKSSWCRMGCKDCYSDFWGDFPVPNTLFECLGDDFIIFIDGISGERLVVRNIAELFGAFSYIIAGVQYLDCTTFVCWFDSDIFTLITLTDEGELL
ncbi:hypothetical protein ElyMa_001701900 [Elysia marginata]|uniref:Uncharacterized protein n=1 Tax=Elysia marginata TaxID=1093978 RepID=A0AAV4JW78_9GAST|nr:hypothetical protein ElyMa_001701900 [Elysia marginata]